jgi:hypothetical protein
MQTEIGVVSSALNYSNWVPRYTDLKQGRFSRHLPVNTISNATTINFNLTPSEDYLDPQECFIVIDLKITKADGNNLVEADNVAFADNTAFSIFKSVNLYLNNVNVAPSPVYLPYANFIATYFGTSKAASKIHLRHLQGLTGEAAGKHDGKNAEATGWSARKKWTEKSKTLRLVGQVPHDFFRSCSTFVTPMQDIRLEFKLSDADFALVGAAGPFSYKLEGMELMARYVKVDPSVTMGIVKQQAIKPLNLNFTHLETQSFSITAGKTVENIRGIFPLMLIETDRINGSLSKEPFKFENGSVEKIILRHDGEAVMIDSMKSRFDAANLDAKIAYYMFCQGLDLGNSSRDVNLTYEQFSNGSTVWIWTLNPDMDAQSGVSLVQKPANFEADIYIKAGQNNPALTALFVGKFGKTILLGKDNIVTVI